MENTLKARAGSSRRQGGCENCENRNSEVIERKACLPRTRRSLQGHATYRSLSYTPRHHCCEQDLCDAATMPHRLPRLLLITPLILVASLTWGAHLLHQPAAQDSSTIAMALETPAQTLLRSAQEPDLVQRPHTPWAQHLHGPLPKPDSYRHCSSLFLPRGTYPEPSLIKNTCSKSPVFSKCLWLMQSLSPSSLARQAFDRAVGPRQGDRRGTRCDEDEGPAKRD
ncbi:hypothetical protein DBR06_SOUSAS30410110 [Sousa chinensis]|nr:hypothetical protein DBR06_SOUSAS30410110 [Sousa chinensis]